MSGLTLRNRLYIGVAVLALLLLALGGMTVRWVGSLKPAQRRAAPGVS
ncbi:MAG: hypothetical protein QOE36_834 [Gaiellaceae bacterium]|nr:hypothetical protein [Gaiellaceae bacterium]